MYETILLNNGVVVAEVADYSVVAITKYVRANDLTASAVMVINGIGVACAGIVPFNSGTVLAEYKRLKRQESLLVA